MIKNRLLYLIAIFIELTTSVSLYAQYQIDILGTPYEYQYLDLTSQNDRKPKRATLIRHKEQATRSRAVLYIHGYNDYFFQTNLADSISSWGYDFYALDLHGYGRSLREGERLFECHDLREYQDEIDKALDIIHTEGKDEVYLMAHSTGGLISALYLHDSKNKQHIRGLILNSPFIDYQSTKFNEKVLLPLVTSMAWLAPSAVIIPAGEAGNVESYAQSLLSEFRGLWQFNRQWKRPEGYPIRASWLRAIKRGHRRVRQGLNIDIPILLMSSTRSILPDKAWRSDYDKVDLVLDVEDMWRYGTKLGQEIHFVKIPNGIHDLVLSPDPDARRLTYKSMHRWLMDIYESNHNK